MSEPLSPAQTPQMNPMFRLQWEQAQDSYVLLYPEGMVKLNGSAGEIMAMIDGQRDVATISDQLMAKFPDAGDIRADILEFIGQAQQQNWITL